MPFQLVANPIQYITRQRLTPARLAELARELHSLGLPTQRVAVALSGRADEQRQWRQPPNTGGLLQLVNDLTGDDSRSPFVWSFSFQFVTGGSEKLVVAYSVPGGAVSITHPTAVPDTVLSIIKNYLPPSTPESIQTFDDLEALGGRLHEAYTDLDFLEERIKANLIKTNEISKTTDDIQGRHNSTKERLESVSSQIHTLLSSSSASEKSTSEIHSRIVAIRQHADNERERLTEASNKISEIHSDISSKRDRIDSVYRNLVDYESRLAEYQQTLDKIESEAKSRYAAKIAEWDDRLTIQEKVAEKHASRAEELLRTANATKLNSSFNDASRKGSALLITLIILIVITTVGAAAWVMWLTWNGLAANKISEASLLLRYLSVSPILVLDWFLIREFTTLRRTRERYAYKSAVLMSFPEFERFAAERGESNDLTNMLFSKIIENVYKSPFDDEFLSTEDRKQFISLFEKSIGRTGRVAKDLIKAVKNK